MTKAEEMRAKRYLVIRQTCRELRTELQDFNPKDTEVIASTKRTLDIFRKEAMLIQTEIQFESGYEVL